MLNYENFLDQIYKFTDAYRQEMSYRKITNRFVDNIIEARRQKLRDSNNNNSNDSEDDLDSCFKANIFLDEIFNIRFDGKPLDDKEVSDHMYTMIAAVSCANDSKSSSLPKLPLHFRATKRLHKPFATYA